MDSTRRLLLSAPLAWGGSSALQGRLSSAANEAPLGGEALAFRRVESNAQERSLADFLSDRVSVLDWIPASKHALIAARQATGDLTTFIQAAFDEAPIGCDLHFPPGLLQVNRPLSLTRFLNLVGNHSSIRARFDNREQDLLTIAVRDPENSDTRNMRITGFRAITFDSGGRHALRVANLEGNVANIGLYIAHNVIETLDSSAGFALVLEGVGTHFNTIENNSIRNGVYLACADGTVVDRNVIAGVRPAVTLDLVPGAFRTSVSRNAMVARDGALRVLRGSQWEFHGNQVEQYQQEGVNQSSHQASITILGGNEPNVCHHGIISSNNFGGGANVRRSIAIVSGCEDLIIENNVFNVCTMTTDSVDVAILDPSVKWTRFGYNNTFRGLRRTEDLSGQARTANPRNLLQIDDVGLGTYGTWKGPNALALKQGWQADPGFRFSKTEDDRLVFEGSLKSGSAKSGTVLGSLPLGYRPAESCFLGAFDPVNQANCWFKITPDGAIAIVDVAPDARPNFNSASLAVAGRSGYTPGI